jgi:hypothetical protein
MNAALQTVEFVNSPKQETALGRRFVVLNALGKSTAEATRFPGDL